MSSCACVATPAIIPEPNLVVVTGFTFAIPDTDADFFVKQVQQDEKLRVRELLKAVAEIHGAKNKQEAIRRLALSLQVSPITLTRNYYDYTTGAWKCGGVWFDAGDWRTIVRWTKVRDDDMTLPFAFLELWRELGELNQRKWKPAHDELLHIYRTHQGFPHGTNREVKLYTKLPGYDQWPKENPVLGHPPGWSYRNLMRHASDRYDQSLARHGRAKASEDRLPVLKTREGVEAGSVLIFDDHDFNQKVLFQKKPQRPMGFGCVDYLSACLVKLGVKPMLIDEDDGRKRTLTEREFLWFFLAVISGVGFNPKGCRFDLENAKATIRDPWLSRLKAILGPKFVFNFGSRPANFTQAAHGGQFEGRPKGNPRTKALMESFWNPVDNQTAGLAGQMGKDREHSPAQLAGAEKYTGGIIRQAEAQGVALGALQFPFDHYSDWCANAHEAIARINAATDHDLEAWEKLGFAREQWRENEQTNFWLERSEFEALPETTRAIVRARLDANPQLVRPVRLSRQDVFNGCRKNLRKLQMIHWPEILGPEFALDGGGLQEVGKQKAGLFRFECEEIDTDPIDFYARDERGFLPNGSKHICFVNPYLPTHLIACDDKLRVVAICPRYERTSADKVPTEALGQQRSYEAAARVRLDLRHDDAKRRKRSMQEHNRGLLKQEAAILADAAAGGPDCTADLLADDGE